MLMAMARSAVRPLRRATISLAALACSSCAADPPAPSPLMFAGLPVAGSRDLATRRGFTRCVDMDAIHIRCKRSGVMLMGQGPYEAGVDLSGSDGVSGFRQLTLWSDKDNDRVYDIVVALVRRGWTYCYTGTETAGDQAIFTHPGETVRVSLDISYWSKRRVRIIPQWDRKGMDQPCTPDTDLARFGREVAEAARRPG